MNKKDTPKVSVVIPVYNADKHLQECLDCVVNQDLKNIEIICVDDGSTDDSLKILDQYKEKDTRLSVFKQQNQGSAVARNKGLQSAEGEYIVFLDSDDVFSSKLLSSVYRQAAEHKPDVIVFNYNVLNGYTGAVGGSFLSVDPRLQNQIIKPLDIKDKIFNTFANNVWNKAFKKQFLLENNLLFDKELRRAQDALFTNKALVLAESLIYDDSTLVSYRTGSDESAWTTSYKYPLSTLNYIIKLHDYLIDSDKYSKFQKSFDNLCINDTNGTLERLATHIEFSEAFSLAKKIINDYGLTDRPKTYFYNPDAAGIVRSINAGPEVYLESLISRLQRSEQYFMNQNEIRQKDIDNLQMRLQETTQWLDAKDHELANIYNSKAWKLIRIARRLLHPIDRSE